MKPTKLFKLGDAFSQFINVLVYNGEANHSLSGDAYDYKRLKLQKSIDWFFLKFFKEEEHCKLSHENDIARACNLCHKRTTNENSSLRN